MLCFECLFNAPCSSVACYIIIWIKSSVLFQSNIMILNIYLITSYYEEIYVIKMTLLLTIMVIVCMLARGIQLANIGSCKRTDFHVLFSVEFVTTWPVRASILSVLITTFVFFLETCWRMKMSSLFKCTRKVQYFLSNQTTWNEKSVCSLDAPLTAHALPRDWVAQKLLTWCTGAHFGQYACSLMASLQ